ncbi:MAG: hypothetical protein GEU86_05495 [Actinophytocola sp.]|nr:hypothetical protein [Actinophytocola sp.]
MYVDESGGTDETVTSEEMTVTVDGEDYQADMNADLNDDGVNDTAIVANEDGTRSVYVDSDADGEADHYAEVDSSGQVVAEAAYDDASGDWVAADPSLGGGSEGSESGQPGDTQTSDDTSTGTDGTMTAHLPKGEVEVGQATVDTNEDGVNDTAVAEDPDGTTYYFTDVNGDGEADYVVVVESDGNTVALEHQGGGEWKQIDTGAAPPSGVTGTATAAELPAMFSADAPADADARGVEGVEGVAKIDALTGQWISQN